jgi:hypothetical protein
METVDSVMRRSSSTSRGGGVDGAARGGREISKIEVVWHTVDADGRGSAGARHDDLSSLLVVGWCGWERWPSARRFILSIQLCGTAKRRPTSTGVLSALSRPVITGDGRTDYGIGQKKFGRKSE